MLLSTEFDRRSIVFSKDNFDSLLISMHLTDLKNKDLYNEEKFEHKESLDPVAFTTVLVLACIFWWQLKTIQLHQRQHINQQQMHQKVHTSVTYGARHQKPEKFCILLGIIMICVHIK